MEGHCSTGQSPRWAVVPMEEEEEEEEQQQQQQQQQTFLESRGHKLLCSLHSLLHEKLNFS